MNLKYNISERMHSLPYEKFKKIRQQIPIALGKTQRTFARYCNLPADSFGDIPAQDLDIIASFLGCKADDLKNYTIKNKQIQQKITRKPKKAS